MNDDTRWALFPKQKLKPNPLEELTSAGWVSVPNSGKAVDRCADERRRPCAATPPMEDR